MSEETIQAVVVEQQIDIAISKIAFLCNQINRKTNICVYFNDSGHVNKIEVRILPSKDLYNGIPAEFVCYYNAEGSKFRKVNDMECLQRLNSFVTDLEQILNDKKIDYSIFDPIKEYIITRYEI